MKIADLFVDLHLDTSAFDRELDAALARASRRDVKVGVKADTSSAISDIKKVETELKKLGSSSSTSKAKVDIDDSAIGRLKAEIAALRASMKDDLELDVHTDTSKTRSEISKLTSSLSQLERGEKEANKASGDLAKNLNKSSTGLNRYTGRLALIGDAILGLAPAVSAMTAVAVPAVTAVSQAAVVAGGALLDVKLAFEGVGDALTKMNKAAWQPTETNLANAAIALEKLSPEARKFTETLFSMRGELDKLRDSAGKELFPKLTDSIDILSLRLPQINSLLQYFGGVLGDIAKRSAIALASDRWDVLFTFLNQNAKPTLDDLATAFGHVAHGALELLDAFAPLSRGGMDWVVQATKNFDKWAESLKGTQGFKDFSEYIKENGPRLAKTVGALAGALLAIGKAAAPLSGPVLAAITAFANAITRIADSKIGPTLIGAAIALRTWSRVSAVAGPVTSALSNAFLDLRTSPNKAATAFGALRGAASSLKGPAALAGATVALTTTNKAVGALSGAMTGALIGSAFPGFGTAIGAAVGGLAGFSLAALQGKGDTDKFGESLDSFNQNAQSFVQTLNQATGAITQNTLAWEANKLATNGTLDGLKELGISGSDALTGVLKGGQDMTDVYSQLDGIIKDNTKTVVTNRGAYVYLTDTGKKAQDMKEKLKQAFEEVKQGKSIFEATKDAVNGSADAFTHHSKAAQEAARETRAFNNAMVDLDNFLSGRQTMRDYQQALDDFTKSLEENGRNFDINTQKGRNNQAALDGLAQKAEAAAAKMKPAQGKTFLLQFYEQMQTIKRQSPGAAAAIDEITGHIKKIIGPQVFADFKRLQAAQESMKTGFGHLGDAVANSKGKLDNFRSAAATLADKNTVVGGTLATLHDRFKSAMAAAQDMGASQKTLTGIHEAYRNQLIKVFNQMGLNRAETQRLINKYDEVPATILTKAEWEDTKAKSDTRTYAKYVHDQLAGIKDEPVAINLSAQAAKIANELGNMFASGGAVRGRGTGTSDSIPALLSNGEHVITAKEVQAMGGQHAVELWRKAALRRHIPDPADLPHFDYKKHRRRFALGGPVEDIDTVPSPHGTFNDDPIVHLVHSIASGISSKISKIVNKLFSFGGAGKPLGPGGTMSPGQLARGMQFARSRNGRPYVWGGTGRASDNFGYDCSGFQSSIIQAALGRDPTVRIGSTGTMPWNNSPGVGRYTIGYYKGSPGHTSGNINGLGVESTGDHVRVGSAANSPLASMFTGRFHYAGGGHIKGPGSGVSDSILAALSNGEYVMKANAVKKYGVDFMEAVNAGMVPVAKYAAGGLIKGVPDKLKGLLRKLGFHKTKNGFLPSAKRLHEGVPEGRLPKAGRRLFNNNGWDDVVDTFYAKGTPAYRDALKSQKQAAAAHVRAQNKADYLFDKRLSDLADQASAGDIGAFDKEIAILVKAQGKVKKWSDKWVELQGQIDDIKKQRADAKAAIKDAIASFKLGLTGDTFHGGISEEITPGADFRSILGGVVDQAKELLDMGAISTKAFTKISATASKYLHQLNGIQTSLDAVNQKIEDQTQVLDDAKAKLEEATAAYNDYVAGVHDSITALGDFASMDDGIQTQADSLQELTDAQDQYNKTLSVYGQNSANTAAAQDRLTKAQSAAKTGALTGSSILGNIQSQIATAKTFIANVKKLAGLGLGETALKEIIAMGPLQGGPFAQALVNSTPDVLNSINNAQTELSSLGQEFGVSAASWFGLDKNMQSAQMGVNIAQGILDGLNSQKAALEAQMKALGEAMAAAFKAALAIKSPSRVFEEAGINTLLGLQKGLASQVPDTIGMIDGLAGRLGTAGSPAQAAGYSTQRTAGGGVVINGGVHLNRDVDVDTLTQKLGFWSRQSGRTR